MNENIAKNELLYNAILSGEYISGKLTGEIREALLHAT